MPMVKSGGMALSPGIRWLGWDDGLINSSGINILIWLINDWFINFK